MALDKEEFARAIEEFKEVGHEYRYRDQLMVQEFNLSMVAASVAINAVVTVGANSFGAVAIQIVGLAFLWLLTLHLRNINQDRRAALDRKEALIDLLEFKGVHQNPQGTAQSVPQLMVWFALCVTVARTAWTIYASIMLAGVL